MKAYGGADSDESDTEVEEVDVENLPPIEIGPDEHKLQYTYCLWYHRGSYKIKNPSVKVSFHLFDPPIFVELTFYRKMLLLRIFNNTFSIQINRTIANRCT